MIRMLIKSLKGYAWFRRINAKITYEILAAQVPGSDWQFMNYGYVPKSSEPALTVSNDVASQIYPLQMYHYLATKIDIEGKHLLEVGSGRGGGARYIASTLKPASYTGMDIAKSAVDLSNRLHRLPNLKFIQGSAESIPLPDNSVDVILNVESCHAYGSVEKFLSEVKRVLKPGGYLMLVDFRSENKMCNLQADLRNTGMELLEEEDISQNVIASIEAEDESKRQRINRHIPARWQKLFSEFAGVVGSNFYTTLRDGSRHYYRFVIRKAA